MRHRRGVTRYPDTIIRNTEHEIERQTETQRQGEYKDYEKEEKEVNRKLVKVQGRSTRMRRGMRNRDRDRKTEIKRQRDYEDYEKQEKEINWTEVR